MTDPRSPGQWQEAVNIAELMLRIDSARKYGLITGGPVANVDRCDRILRRAKSRGVVPQEQAIDELLATLARGPHRPK